jgi:hypothetical protein
LAQKLAQDSPDAQAEPRIPRHLAAGEYVYLDEPTSQIMRMRFGYCFATPPGSQYPPITTDDDFTRAEALRTVGRAY